MNKAMLEFANHFAVDDEEKAHRQVGVELVEGRGYEPYEARR